MREVYISKRLINHYTIYDWLIFPITILNLTLCCLLSSVLAFIYQPSFLVNKTALWARALVPLASETTKLSMGVAELDG